MAPSEKYSLNSCLYHHTGCGLAERVNSLAGNVAPLNVKVERPQLSRDSSLLTFVGKVNGASDDSMFVYKRDGSSYVMVKSFALGGNASMMDVSAEMNYVAVLCSGKGIQIRDAKNGNDRTPEGPKKIERRDGVPDDA